MTMVCTRSFTAKYDGQPETINVGERFADAHELVALKPDAFETEANYRRLPQLPVTSCQNSSIATPPSISG